MPAGKNNCYVIHNNYLQQENLRKCWKNVAKTVNTCYIIRVKSAIDLREEMLC